MRSTKTDIGEKLRSESLQNFGANLTDGIKHVRSKEGSELKRRDLQDDISSTFRDLTGAGGIGGFNLTGGLAGVLGSLGDLMTGSLGTPALFLGIGLGMGTTTALNLTDMEEANAIASSIATAYNASASGANLVAQQLGNGLSRQITPSFDDNNFSLAPAAFALASGIGNATAVGFGLTEQRFAPSSDSSIEGLAGNFGLGVAMPIVSNIDLRATIKSLGNSSGVSSFMQNLPKIAAAAGLGLGEGARNGLGLTASEPSGSENQKRQSVDPTADTIDFPRTVKHFARGLSQSFIQGSNFSNLDIGSMTAFPNTTELQAMLRPMAAGAGAGIGMGIAIGLNFKAVDAPPMIASNIDSDNEQTALAAEGFTQNLFSNLLINGTAIQQAKSFIANNPPQALQGIDGAKAAEGLARGTIEGVVSAMYSVGGVKNLISGDLPDTAYDNVPVLAPTQFNDTLNGSAVGFARGLTGKATILVAEIVRNLTQGMSKSDVAPPSRRSIVGEFHEDSSVVASSPITARQSQGGASQFPIAIDPATAQKGAQKLVDTLTCQGIGGIASAAFGAMAAARANATMMGKAMGQLGQTLDPTVLQALPRGPITVLSEGNMFEIIIESQSVKINGLALVPFAVITGLHVLFAGLAFLTFLPLYLVLGVVWRFSVLTGFPVDEAKNRKWRMGFLITFAILGITGIILGMVGMGSSRHFRDTHGIMGLICLIFLFPAVGFSIVRLRTEIPHPSPAAFAGIKGPIAVAKTPQRIYLVSGISTQLLLGLGQFAFLQGFATLRAISLCVADAVLTSASVSGLVSIVLMIQISATALVGIRAWLEQHIAKKEAAGMTRTTTVGSSGLKRSDTMATFGFDRKDPLSVSRLITTKPKLTQRKTEELKGSEDSGIGTPFNFRKEGSINEAEAQDDNFLSPEERINYQERGIYNPKTGGYTYPVQSMNYGDEEFYNRSTTYGERRPSSGVFDPLLSPRPPMAAATGPRMTGVTVQDLWPPPMPASLYMTTRTQKTVSSRYSRPIDGNVPVRDSFMGFGNR
ncbi:uncharacterized protein J4E84_002718 [Alternaria hordeiaustralica]|uniref:uncharacterized protein n=1 Tax=Alternaria hordeiaustralica TaxID=1187925 RepID=UPI0020C4A79F|nr:uncharacterized protein J4E84_002718 [Alternaria hordeiaustralica]KAI4694137.1 hypothetical protein J4E84_002718 [Alternaria hordeiaustralica]